MPESAEMPIDGVHALDHTADVGLEVGAPDLPTLLERAALGLTWLLLERRPQGAPTERKVHVDAATPAALLRELLRELLWWHESEGLAVTGLANGAVEETPDGSRFTAIARLVADPGPPIREIKGVTLHDLTAEPRDDGWYGRIIFDV